MKRINPVARTLAFTAMLAALPLGLSAQVTYYVEAGAAGPGDGSSGDPFTTLAAAYNQVRTDAGLGQHDRTIFVRGGNYGSELLGASPAVTINNLTITADTADRPNFTAGIRLTFDNLSTFTLENISITGRFGATGDQNFLLGSVRNPTVGRENVTIRNNVFNGGGDLAVVTNGINLFRTKGTLVMENNTITGLTGNVILSQTNAGSVTLAEYDANQFPSNVLIRNNTITNSTGAIDTRGYDLSNSNHPASKNPIITFSNNSFTNVPASAQPSGGAFKLFHAKEAYFYGNTIQATNTTSNAYGNDPCAPTVLGQNRGAGVLFLNVGTLVAAGNNFIDCLQGLAHDPNPNQGNRTQNHGLPQDFRVFNNTFSFCGTAVYFPPPHTPGLSLLHHRNHSLRQLG